MILYTDMLEYYSDIYTYIYKDEILPFDSTWIKLNEIIHEVSQREKAKY